MRSPRRRGPRSSRYAARAGAWLERTGAAVLVGAWSLGVRLVAALAIGIEAGAVAGARWFVGQRLAIKLAVVGAAALAALVIGRRPTAVAPIYLTDDAEALARVVKSEAGPDAMHQLHIAWVTRNLAAERAQSIARMACSPCGEQGPGRPVSSRQDADDRTRALARLVLAAPGLLDPTGGATHFINPVLQDELARSGRLPGYAGNTYAVVRQRWLGYGWVPYYRLGPTLELWGRARAPAKRVARRR